MKKLKVSTKTLVAVVTALGSLWQVPEIHDLVLAQVHAHPHWAGAVGWIATIWAILHNPQVQQLFGGDSDQTQAKGSGDVA